MPVLLPHELLHTLHKHGPDARWKKSILGSFAMREDFYRSGGPMTEPTIPTILRSRLQIMSVLMSFRLWGPE